ncbi:MAG: chemotaxis-specific protein-glutamate methyltransferase CheB [Lachnospiraceae bacterium]|nr:chemotaxis-specific protein-glutamate methyltransferase CheB [Lachnospiraceae bacterium]
MKKILVVDDSALMRRIICDIISADNRFFVQDMAANGEEAMSLLKEHSYDAVILDVIMPKMDGIAVLEQIRRLGIETKVVVFSTTTTEGAATTIKALELGAFDFIHKPNAILEAKTDHFMERFLSILDCATQREEPMVEKIKEGKGKMVSEEKGSNKIVAIASSTGGPKALQEVIPYLTTDLDAPVLIVQHMPAGFTASLAQRLDELSALHVQEAQDGMEICKGNVYLAQGGKHMEVAQREGRHYIVLKDGPTREGVRPCANFMFETLGASGYDSVVCVVLTGMGADGTQGIQNLSKQKSIHVIAQEKSTCAVYGMPRSVVATGIVDQIEPLDNIASAIILNAGVK